MMKLSEKIDIKRIIKIGTIAFGFILIIFMSFFSATFDFKNFNWSNWLANSSILVGIMIYGILMGNSIGSDIQKEKVGGRFQLACNEYTMADAAITQIKDYFSQFWLWYKERKLIEKKIDFLVSNNFKLEVAKVLVHEIEEDDLVEGKLLLVNPEDEVYCKNDILIEKLKEDKIEIIRKMVNLKLDTLGESYYLALFDDNDSKTNQAELGKTIMKKIDNDKRNSFIVKIISSLLISLLWTAITIKDFTEGGGDDAKKQAWLNLLSRLTSLITSFFSGYSTSVVNVRDQARAIENKSDILKYFKNSYDNKEFVPETYEEMLKRKYNKNKESII